MLGYNVVNKLAESLKMEEKLIRLVYEHKLLYDNTMPLYKDQQTRNAAWEDIGSALNMPGNKCSKIWGNLRKCFANARKRHNEIPIGQNPKKMKKWKYEDEMAFILPFSESRSTSNWSTSPRTDYQYYDNGTILDSLLEHSSPSTAELNGRMTGNSRIPNLKTEDVVQMMKTNQEAKQTGEKRNRQQHNKESYDEVELFYLSMARTIKKLPPIDQAIIRMDFCKLVSQAEISFLQSNRVTSTASSPLSYQVSNGPWVVNSKSITYFEAQPNEIDKYRGYTKLEENTLIQTNNLDNLKAKDECVDYEYQDGRSGDTFQNTSYNNIENAKLEPICSIVIDNDSRFG